MASEYLNLFSEKFYQNDHVEKSFKGEITKASLTTLCCF